MAVAVGISSTVNKSCLKLFLTSHSSKMTGKIIERGAKGCSHSLVRLYTVLAGLHKLKGSEKCECYNNDERVQNVTFWLQSNIERL